MTHAQQILAGEKFETKDGAQIVSACEEDCEESFSRHSCDLCNSHLGGERHRAALIGPDLRADPIYLEVCVCCLMYVANGDLCSCDNEISDPE